ncbi:putative bacteriophage protein [Shigella sonnei]|uniref:hypothetical protein n=4 Tax=Shigella sonnei TaxID=624 RepID=UPI0009730D2E|nr:hypothetical protein [Shigella sonnei]SIZ47901.1 putative bacteriophage protein [Shigella sonnei]SIZ77403.1 putative bacteriophage protein [Shigella sonnei]SIZ90779.1 putative bacteriophage protein [Shigella sonnei]SIZ93958.1 putative bacteriophage protein [Shigella sonnei]
MEIKPEDELSNIVLFPVKEDDPRNQVNFLYEPSERPYCHHASVRVDEKERQVRCKICGAVVEPFDWMLSVAKRETRLADDVMKWSTKTGHRVRVFPVSIFRFVWG